MLSGNQSINNVFNVVYRKIYNSTKKSRKDFVIFETFQIFVLNYLILSNLFRSNEKDFWYIKYDLQLIGNYK